MSYETPINKIFTNPPAQQLEVDVQGRGWDLLGLAFSGQQRVLTIPVAENEVQSLSALSLNNKVMKLLPKANILNIFPENIDLKTEEIATKTVPVILEEQIRLAPLYQYVDSIRINPKTIEITGPASVIRDIHNWKTNILIPPKEVNQNIDVDLALATHPNSNVTCSAQKIRCTAAVEEITEKQIEVPIEIVNAPDSLLLVLLPKKITVSCQVGLSDYAGLKAEEFKAIVDFENVDLFQQKFIRILLRAKPTYVRQVQYFPQQVEYIMRSRNL